MKKRLNLKGFRAEKDLTQLDMAKICGCSLSTYNSMENGNNDGKMKYWENIETKFKLERERLCELQQKQTTQEF